MVLLGLIIPASQIPDLTRDFLALKRRHFPGRFSYGPALDHALTEVKGSDILQMTRKNSRDRRRQASLVRYAILDLIDGYGCRVIGRVWVKEKGKSLKSDATYCYAVQDIAWHSSEFLLEYRSKGVMIADGRTPGLNVKVAHSIFTQKWRTAGDPYPPLLEVPLFSHSDNHVGLQIADLVASTLVLPMAAAAYGASPGCIHASSRYPAVRADHGEALRDLQYRYRDETAAGAAVSSSAIRPAAGPDRCSSGRVRARSG
ncbi:hypothetical protein GCM10010151_28900 [Actinoallomurus spadix]|uniref:Uncharacterized protein n=1 Tax=Actinoallomurus spadix TaxID=79912 RepID=A0ABN0WI54_9ACTN